MSLLVLPRKLREVVSEIELAKIVALENEIRCLRAQRDKCQAELRRKLRAGAEVEEGPLQGFAEMIAGVKPRRKAGVR